MNRTTNVEQWINWILVASLVVVRSVRITSFAGDVDLLELSGSSTSDANPPAKAPKCPGSKPKEKSYYIDLPKYNGKETPAALLLKRDPRDPELVVFEGAVWTVVQEVDNRRRPKGANQMLPVLADGSKAEGIVYSLTKDLIQLTRDEDDSINLLVEKCEAGTEEGKKANATEEQPTLEAAVPPSTGSVRGSGAYSNNYGGSVRPSARGWRGSGRYERGSGKSRGKRSYGQGGYGKGSGRRARSWIETYASASTDTLVNAETNCSFGLALGTYYRKEIMSRAIRARLRKQTGSTLKFKASEVKQYKKKPGFLGAFFGAGVAGAVGYNVPLLTLFENGASVAPLAAGAAAAAVGIPALLLAIPARKSAERHNAMTGTDLLFEKLYCLSQQKTCGGNPCFKVCRDWKKSLVLVPYQKEPLGVIRC